VASSDNLYPSNQTNKVVVEIKTDSPKASLHESFAEIFGCEKPVCQASCSVDPSISNIEDVQPEEILVLPLQDPNVHLEEIMEREFALIEK
jgi:hypothetical protein